MERWPSTPGPSSPTLVVRMPTAILHARTNSNPQEIQNSSSRNSRGSRSRGNASSSSLLRQIVQQRIVRPSQRGVSNVSSGFRNLVEKAPKKRTIGPTSESSVQKLDRPRQRSLWGSTSRPHSNSYPELLGESRFSPDAMISPRLQPHQSQEIRRCIQQHTQCH